MRRRWSRIARSNSAPRACILETRDQATLEDVFIDLMTHRRTGADASDGTQDRPRRASSPVRRAAARSRNRCNGCVAMFVKEFIQLRRDRADLRDDHRHSADAAVAVRICDQHRSQTSADGLLTCGRRAARARASSAPCAPPIISTFQMSPRGEADADRLILSNKVQFVIQIPPDFSRQLIRGEKPALLVIADATDPTATSGAIAAALGRRGSGARPRTDRPAGHLAQERAALRDRACSGATIRLERRGAISCPD